jgi:hypothetical protein
MAEGYAALVKIDLNTKRSVPFEDEFKTQMSVTEGRSLGE